MTAAFDASYVDGVVVICLDDNDDDPSVVMKIENLMQQVASVRGNEFSAQALALEVRFIRDEGVLALRWEPDGGFNQPRSVQ
jgi:hypothetical protein